MIINASRRCSVALSPRPRSARRVVLAVWVRFRSKVAEMFHKHGWEVFMMGDGGVHAITAETEPQVVVLPEDAGDESGYLTCAKLRLVRPELRLVIVGAERTPERERFAEFVGATFATAPDEIAAAV